MSQERKLKLGSEEKRIVWGEVYIPGVPDTDGEFMTAETIEKMAYDFMRNLRLKMVDTQHTNNLVEDACVVESFIARKGDPDFIEGSWVAGVHIPDDATWSSIKKGDINGFSLEALVTKETVELELDIPPVLAGRTQKHDADGVAHEHEFFVSYDEAGNFLGGRTSIVDGHYHSIKRGTVTEEAAGHRHRFAYMDLMQQADAATVIKDGMGDSQGDITATDLELAGKKNPEQSAKLKKRRAVTGGLGQYVGP